MPRTTIDGLAVREAPARKPRTQPSRPQRVVGGALVESSRKKAREDFLGPVAGFEEAETETVAEFNAHDDSDWSDLLTQLERREAEKIDLDEIISEEEADLKPKKQRAGKKPRRPRRAHKGRRIVICAATVSALIAGVLYFWGDGIISRLTNGNSGLLGALFSMMSDTVPFEMDGSGRTNVLIFGTEGYNMAGEVGNGKHDGSQLTDSIMVVSFDQKTKDVAMISLPRDLKVRRACGAGKINEVFQCYNKNGEDEKAGAEALKTQVGEILGLNIQYWAHVNWGSVVSIVDTIGGITVTLDEDVSDYGYTKVVIKAGVPTKLTGNDAVALARARHGTLGGDFTRGSSQQKILEGIATKIVSNGVDAMQAFNLLNILGDNLRSNFNTDNIKAGAALLSNFDASAMRQLSLSNYNREGEAYVKTANINEISYVIPSAGENNYTAIHEYMRSELTSDPVQREHAKIAVFNATSGFGLANAERERLNEAGFNVTEVGDAAEGSCAEKICVFALDESKTATREALEKHYGVAAQLVSALPAGVKSTGAAFVVLIGNQD